MKSIVDFAVAETSLNCGLDGSVHNTFSPFGAICGVRNSVEVILALASKARKREGSEISTVVFKLRHVFQEVCVTDTVVRIYAEAYASNVGVFQSELGDGA